MRSSPENYIAWKGGKGQAATRDTEIISTTLCATCPLFSVFFLKQIQTFQSTVYWAALRRCRLPLHSVSAFNFLNREKIRRKRNSDSNSLSEYPTTFLYTSYSTGKHTRMLFSVCSQVLLFSSPTHILDTAHI